MENAAVLAQYKHLSRIATGACPAEITVRHAPFFILK